MFDLRHNANNLSRQLLGKANLLRASKCIRIYVHTKLKQSVIIRFKERKPRLKVVIKSATVMKSAHGGKFHDDAFGSAIFVHPFARLFEFNYVRMLEFFQRVQLEPIFI